MENPILFSFVQYKLDRVLITNLLKSISIHWRKFRLIVFYCIVVSLASRDTLATVYDFV